MKNVESLLSKFSVFDIRRLLRAKRLHAARASVMRRVQSLSLKLEDASRTLEKLDRKLGRLIRRTGRIGRRGPGCPPGRAPGRSARRAVRKGSLRSYLAAALRKAGAGVAVRDLAELAIKAGYKTKSNLDVFLRAVNQALHVNPEFVKAAKGKYALRK